MQIRIVRLDARHPLVGALLVLVALALLAVLVTAGLALVAGGAVLGTVGYVARRLLGGAPGRPGRVRVDLRPLGDEVFPANGPLPGREVFPPGPAAGRRLPPAPPE